MGLVKDDLDFVLTYRVHVKDYFADYPVSGNLRLARPYRSHVLG
jgi:hypothetical protein